MFLPIKKAMAVLSVFIITFTSAHAAMAKDFCLGTFSSLHLHKESGDLSGTEIKIVTTRAGKQAAIQFSDGEPGSLIVTPLACDGAHVSFKLPRGDEHDAAFDGATFKGIVSANRLVGEFVFQGGGREHVTLARRKSYWD